MDSCQQQQLKKQLKIHDKVLIDHQLKVHEKSEAMGISTEWMHHIIMQELDTSKSQQDCWHQNKNMFIVKFQSEFGVF